MIWIFQSAVEILPAFLDQRLQCSELLDHVCIQGLPIVIRAELLRQITKRRLDTRDIIVAELFGLLFSSLQRLFVQAS